MNNTAKILETINQEISQAKQYITNLTAAKAAIMGAVSYTEAQASPQQEQGFSSIAKKYTSANLNTAISATLGKRVPKSMNYYYLGQLIKNKRIERVSAGTYKAV